MQVSVESWFVNVVLFQILSSLKINIWNQKLNQDPNQTFLTFDSSTGWNLIAVFFWWRIWKKKKAKERS